MKRLLGQKKRNILMLIDYLEDFRLYQKYNFGNYKNKDRLALEAKIRRQIHIIEKGMSLSHPRVGFGKEKIKILLEYLDEYQNRGYSNIKGVVEDIIGTLQSYASLFEIQGYHNVELEKKLKNYDKCAASLDDYGVCSVDINELNKKRKEKFPDFLLSRHSTRQFSDKDVAQSVIEDAVKLAMHTPSACNRQSARVYVVTDSEKNKQLGKLIEGNTGFAEEVNKYLVITGDRMGFNDSYERNQFIIDASLFAMDLVLALHYYGVGSCLLQASERKKLDKERHKLLDIPRNEKIVLFIAVGYYKEKFTVAKSKRKSIDEYLIIR